jgi:RNA polymerase sigma factor (sigma-70 family)
MIAALPRAVALDEQGRALVVRHQSLARFLAGAWARRWPRFADEFLSAAMMALTESAMAYEPHRGIEFSRYAGFRIKRALAQVLRDEMPCGYRSRPDLQPRLTNLGLSDVVDPATLPRPYHEISVDFEHMMGLLPSRCARICRLAYLHNRTHREIAAELGVSKATVSTYHCRALKILRDYIRDDEG